MRKHILWLVLGVLLCLSGCGAANVLSPSEAEKAYENIKEKGNAAEYAKLFENIAKGDKAKADGYDDFGLQDIVVSRGLDGKYTIGFEYCGEVRAYSVESVNNGEQVKVTFYDTKPSEVFLDKYSFADEHQVEGLNLKLEYTADHGVVIYIRGAGLEIEEKETTTMGRPEGTIEIEL